MTDSAGQALFDSDVEGETIYPTEINPYFPESYAIRKHSESDGEHESALGNGLGPSARTQAPVSDDDDDNTEEAKQRPPPKYRKLRSRQKIVQIKQALSQDPVDLSALQSLATSEGGLVNDALRRKVWPQLLQIDPYEVSPMPSQTEIKGHKEYTQVLMDVQRCLRRFPPGIPPDRRMALQDQLTCLIVRVLLKHPKLSYYQGYHDICVTFLLVLGEELAFALLEKLSMTRLKQFMEPTMESTVEILNFISPIIGQQCPQLHKHLIEAQVSPIFCLSWLITWFGHVLGDYRKIVRLYDFFLAAPQLMPVYLAAAVVLHQRQAALQLEADMATIHHFLSNVPDDLPFEELLEQASRLHSDYPPDQLRRDTKRDLRAGNGFFHYWSSTDSKLSFSQRLAKRLKRSVSWILPEVDGHYHWLRMAGLVALPVVVAILVLSYTSNKYTNYLNPYS